MFWLPQIQFWERGGRREGCFVYILAFPFTFVMFLGKSGIQSSAGTCWKQPDEWQLPAEQLRRAGDAGAHHASAQPSSSRRAGCVPWAIGIPVRDCHPRAGSLLSAACLGAPREARRSPRASLIPCQRTLVTKPEVRWEEPDPLAFCSQGFETLKVLSSLDLFHPTDIVSSSEVAQNPLTT